MVALMSGTSMAAAHVSGAAALFLAQNPQATPAQVSDALRKSSRPRVVGAPLGTTNATVYAGPDSDLIGSSLPPFFAYAITAGDRIEVKGKLVATRADDAQVNTNLFANKEISFEKPGSLVEGFGYYKDNITAITALATFQPRLRDGATVNLHGALLAGEDIQVNGDLTLHGSATTGRRFKVKDNHTATIYFAPAPKALTAPFWN